MPTAKAHRRSGTEDRNRRRLQTTKSLLSSSPSSSSSNSEQLPVPDLLISAMDEHEHEHEQARPRLTKLLMKVTIQGKVGAVHVLISPELTVGDLIAAVLRQYMKEGRRLTIPSSSCDPDAFNLHYSQFILQCLDKEKKLIEVGSRNFFLATPPPSQSPSPSPPPSCADFKATKTLFAPWLKFIDHLF